MVDIQSLTAEIRRGNKKRRKKEELECGPVPNVMAALPNISGALCSTPQSLAEADAHYQSAGVPQTRQQISAVSRPKFTISVSYTHLTLPTIYSV